MNKTIDLIKKFGKYLREISAIVIGVAITLFASYLLSVKSEKRDMVLYLNAMMIELEENITVLNKASGYFTTSVEYTQYLQLNDIKSLISDTIQKYTGNCYRIESYTFKTNAFEMFKSSGIMRLVKDKELLLSIWNAYTDLNELKEGFDWHEKIKWDFMKEDFSAFDFFKGETKKDFIPMHTYYSLGIPYGLLKGCEETLTSTREAIGKLKESM